MPGPKKSKIFIVSAPSGCGKTTLCKMLLDDNLGLEDSISMTTRPPRPGEKDGIDYRFVSDKEFRAKINNNEFLEYEENFGNLYGTPKDLIEESIKNKKSVLLSIDVKGALKVKAAYPEESVLIFILPPSIEDLKKRLEARMSDSSEVITRRLDLAEKEMAYQDKYDYRIVNDDLQKAYKKLKTVITQNLGR